MRTLWSSEYVWINWWEREFWHLDFYCSNGFRFSLAITLGPLELNVLGKKRWNGKRSL